MANVCAVRTVLAGDAFTPVKWLLVEKPLPHEPKSDISYVLKYRDGTMASMGFLGDFAECRHCGAVYREKGE